MVNQSGIKRGLDQTVCLTCTYLYIYIYLSTLGSLHSAYNVGLFKKKKCLKIKLWLYPEELYGVYLDARES